MSTYRTLPYVPANHMRAHYMQKRMARYKQLVAERAQQDKERLERIAREANEPAKA